jgi:hypothetical protein
MPVTKAIHKKKALVKGDKLVCDGCGLTAVIEMPSLTEVTEEIVCCGKPMKLKQTPAKKAPVAKKATSTKR